MGESHRSHFVNLSDDQVWKMVNDLGKYQLCKFHENYDLDGNFRRALFLAKSFSPEGKNEGA
jgi:hypothetical protein